MTGEAGEGGDRRSGLSQTEKVAAKYTLVFSYILTIISGKYETKILVKMEMKKKKKVFPVSFHARIMGKLRKKVYFCD